MEFSDYVAIFRRRIDLILAVLFISLLIGTAVKLFYPERYEAQINLNVTRKAIQKTEEYRYDGFYRLQADERFADTVVRWLETPFIQSKIAELSEIGTGFEIKAKRLSSQMIDVRIGSRDPGSARKLANSVAPSINAETEKIDRIQQDENWFLVIADESIVRKMEIGWDLTVAVSLLGGIFVAFWAVLLMSYFEEKNEDRD